MRIAYLAPRYRPFRGGVEVHVEALAERMAAAGHSVEVLTQESDTSLAAIDHIHGVTVRRFPLLASRAYPVSLVLWRFVYQHRMDYDLVHAHSYHALAAIPVALWRPRALVFTPHYHGTGHTAVGRLLHVPYRTIGGRVFTQSDRIICVSEAEADLVHSMFPEVARHIRVIPNGVDAASIRQARPYQLESRVLLSVGRLLTYKGVQRVIEAVAHLPPEYCLMVVGEGPERPELERVVGRLHLTERVHFLGRVDDDTLHRWMRTATVTVSMSTQEAFGITLQESLVAGSRIVASDIPAHREVLQRADGVSVIVPVNISPESLADAIRGVESKLGRTPQGVLSWDTVAELTISVYAEAIDLRAGVVR